MIPPSIPANESARLTALERYAILDTETETAFDELARLASSICGTPIALISLVDSTRQWFKARIGLALSETPREISFCGHAINEEDIFIVRNTCLDSRFEDNPLVAGPPRIRFYAGAQLTTPEGFRLGTLCVLDLVPRELNEEQRGSLRAIARQVIVQLELRRQIAERAVEAEVMRASEQRLQRVLEGSSDGFWDWNVATGAVSFSMRLASMLGYRLEDMVPHVSTWEALIHPDDYAAVMEELKDHLEGRSGQYEAEHRLRCRNGEWLWILDRGKVVERDPEGRPLRMAGTHTDISKRKEAEEELRRSEARTRSIIDNALGGLISTNERGTIESVNPAASRMFGYPAANLIGRSVCDLVAGHYASRRQCLEHLRVEALNRVTEWQGRRASGETFPCELSLFEFYTGDDQRHFAAHMLDISERHEVERMKNDFVATVSHELRTPLTSIRGSLGLLSSGVMGPLTPQAQEMVAVAERNSVRLIALINDILDFEKLARGKMELDIRRTPLARVLERSIETISAFADQEGVRIELQCPSAMFPCDEARLVQVTVNLLSNAVKYSERGGTVTVDAVVNPEWVEVRIRDHGRGIAPHLHGRLFQQFEQIDASDARPKPGTGLGLAICRAIVEQHGGTIGVDSAVGEGCSFWFRVPATSGAAEASGDGGGLDVLLVEDDAALRDVISTRLSADGLSVRTAASGSSGLAAVGEKVPGVIVLDVDLPDIDGFDVVAELRSDPHHRELPLLVYSCMDLSSAQRSRLRLGPTRFLMKSRSSDDELRFAVSELLDYSKSRESE